MSETGPLSQPDDAMVDLLVKQVTEGLSPAEQRELDAMDRALVSRYSGDFERSVAAVTLAGLNLAPPPAGLRDRLQRQADAHFAAERGAPVAAVPPPRVGVVGSGRRASRSSQWGWAAAAACLIAAVFGWTRNPPATVALVAEVHEAAPPVPPPVAAPPVPAPTPAEQREALLARSGSLKVMLAATKDPAGKGVTGDVVWDPVTQEGFVRFVGLAVNDPKVQQYQIWIFDGTRDKRYPVDAGVFDVPADASEVVIPIQAALSIGMAKAFAVTVEKPGGVVVSALGHVVALGAAG